MPDYDRRVDAPPSPGRRALWVPRILFFPLYVVSEFMLRRPLSAITRWAESRGSGAGGQVAGPLRFFVFDEGRIQIIPTLLVDFGNQPSVGFYFRWNEAGAPNHHLRAHFGFWGLDWVKARVTTRWEPPHERMRAELRVAAQRRGDQRFAGLGSESSPGRPARYALRQLEVLGSFEAEPWRRSLFFIAGGLLEERYGNDAFCCPTIEERVAEGVYSQLPPGYPDGFFVAHLDTDLTLDSRRPRGEGSSGVLLRFLNRFAFDLQDPGGRRWVRFGGSAGLYWDVSGVGHMLGVVGSAQVATAIRGQVPFTQQVELSGIGPLPGFRSGALRGDSGTALTLIYEWPIWMWLDARAHMSLGNVYDGTFDGFALDQQRMSFGVGFTAVHERDHYFHFTLAWGTETIAQGMEVETFRLVLGSEWRL